MCNFLTRRSFLAAAPAVLFAQTNTATVSGTIRLANGKPAVGLAVAVGTHFNYTDISGYYRINGVPFGEYDMLIRQGEKTLKKVHIVVKTAQLVHDDVV
jgi:hypothetical protein